MLERAKAFYRDHEPACTAGLFITGFLFDTLVVGRIDKLHNILHQASYLALCAWFTGLELRERHGSFIPPERLKTAWRYHAGATHFMLGTLLNIYTLFYFKSASLGASSCRGARSSESSRTAVRRSARCSTTRGSARRSTCSRTRISTSSR